MDLCVDFPLDHRTLVDRDTNNLCRDPRIVTWQNKSKVSHWLTPWIAILSSWVAIHFFMDLPVLVIAETSALCAPIAHTKKVEIALSGYFLVLLRRQPYSCEFFCF